MLDLQLGMKSTKNILIAILAGLLVLSLTSQPSQGADSPVTRAEFDALKNRLINAQLNLEEFKKNVDRQKYRELDVMVASNDWDRKKSYEGCSKPVLIDSFNMGFDRFRFDICRLKILVLP